MPIENDFKDIDMELISNLKQAYEEAKDAGFGGSYKQCLDSLSRDELRSMLKDGGPADDMYQNWIKLLEIRSRLSPEELRTIDDLVDQMLKVGTETSADKDGK